MSHEKFWIAYELDRDNNIADRVYRYNRGLMERKNAESGTMCQIPFLLSIKIQLENNFQKLLTFLDRKSTV